MRKTHRPRPGSVTRLVLAGLSLVLLSACSVAQTGPDGRQPVTTDPPSKTVKDYFFPILPNRGPTWTKDGRTVEYRELQSVVGIEICGWQTVVLLHLGWPLGTLGTKDADSRQFVRDPHGVVDRRLQAGLATGIDLPPDVRDTGYRSGELELWLAPDPDAAYLRVGDDVERWPRADPQVGCY